MSDKIILPSKIPLNDMSWQGIRTVCKAGKASEYWKVGDKKAVSIRGQVAATFFDLQTYAFILGFDHNSDVEGKNHIHFCIGMDHGNLEGLCGKEYPGKSSESGFRMNPFDSNIGGWSGSYMRRDVLGANTDLDAPGENTFLAALPRSLREVITPIIKYTDNCGGVKKPKATEVTATKDALWLMSEYEIFGTDNFANPYEKELQEQYDFFKNMKENLIVYGHNMLSIPVYAWTRSPSGRQGDRFCSIDDHGISVISYADFSYSLLVCFAV